MNDDEIADIWETIFVDKWGEIKVAEWNLYKKFARAIAEKEREAILDLVDGYAKNNTDLIEAIRERGQE